MTSARQFPICAECQMKEISQPIADAKMRKFFDIPEDLYKESSFLRSIKSQYIRFGGMTAPQKEAFIKVVKEMKDPSLKAQRAAKKEASEKKFSPRELLRQGLDRAIAKDSKDRRRRLLEVLADLELAGVTDPVVQQAINALVAKERGRAKALLMTKEELQRIRENV